ncbi:MAG: glycosyltransferase family 87 protein [Candidatus Binatia bacterium]
MRPPLGSLGIWEPAITHMIPHPSDHCFTQRLHSSPLLKFGSTIPLESPDPQATTLTLDAIADEPASRRIELTVSRSDALSNGLLLVAICYFVATALCGIGWPYAAGLDFYSFYTASHAALGGQNPYDPAQLQSHYQGLGLAGSVSPYFYPPAWALLFAPLTALPVPVALMAWKATNVVLMMGCLYVGVELYDLERPTSARAKYLAAYALTMSPSLSLLLLGQSTFAVLGFLLLFVFCYERSLVLAGTALALACIKPHLAWPFVLWAMLNRDCKTLGVMLLVNLVGVAAYLYVCDLSIVALANSLRPALTGWSSYPANYIDSPQNIGLASSLYGILSVPRGVAIVGAVALGFTAVGVIARVGKARLPLEQALPLLLLVGLLATTVHPYDLVGVVPVFAWLLGRESSYLRTAGLLTAMILILPLRAVEFAHGFTPESVGVVMDHYRSVVLVALMVVSACEVLRVAGHREASGCPNRP